VYILTVKCLFLFVHCTVQQEEYLFAGCSRSISWHISFIVACGTWSAVSSTRLLQYSRAVRTTLTYSGGCSLSVFVHQSIWKKEKHYTCYWGTGFVFDSLHFRNHHLCCVQYYLHVINIADVVWMKHSQFCWTCEKSWQSDIFQSAVMILAF